MPISRIEKDKGNDVVIIPTLFGDEEMVVARGRSVFVPRVKQLDMEGMIVEGNGEQTRITVLSGR